MFSRIALEEGSFSTEYLVCTGTRTLLLNFNRLKRDDIVFGVSVFGRDITGRKLIESEARKLREELAHVTRVSTLGELASALAHEINQPLAAIAQPIPRQSGHRSINSLAVMRLKLDHPHAVQNVLYILASLHALLQGINRPILQILRNI